MPVHKIFTQRKEFFKLVYILLMIGMISCGEKAGRPHEETSPPEAARIQNEGEKKTHSGMVWVPGGTFVMGTDEDDS